MAGLKLSDIISFDEDEVPPVRGDFDTSDKRQILDHVRYSILSNLMNTTFGKSSTEESPRYSVNMQVMGDDKIYIKYNSVVLFPCERNNFLLARGAGVVDRFLVSEVNEYSKQYTKEAQERISKALENLREEYKKVSEKKTTLTFKVVSVQKQIQLMPTSIHNPRKTSYFYLTALVQFE